MKRLLTFLTIVLFAQCKNDKDIEPTVSFTVQNDNCKAPCEVAFTSTAENATSYLWAFGDGQTSTDTNPRHSYATVGVYEVTLTANGTGGSSTTSQQVKVNLYQKVWDKAFGGTSWDWLSSIVPTDNGGFLLGGSSQSPPSGDKSASSGVRDYWVIKLQ